MAFRVREIDVDGRVSTFVEESYENEIADKFLEADFSNGEEVEVIYLIDDLSGEDIECWRKDWMIERIDND